MKLRKFNPKKINELNHKHYNAMLIDGTIAKLILESRKVDGKEKEVLYFNHEGNYVDPNDVTMIDERHIYSYVAVGDEWAMTRNGKKVFPGNVYGVVSDEMFIQSVVHSIQYYQDTYSPDTIKKGDIVELLFGSDKGKRAVVFDIRKPVGIEDHGMIEVCIFSNQYFDHYTYAGWPEFMKVVEEY